jgi:hypothetical protein
MKMLICLVVVMLNAPEKPGGREIRAPVIGKSSRLMIIPYMNSDLIET